MRRRRARLLFLLCITIFIFVFLGLPYIEQYIIEKTFLLQYNHEQEARVGEKITYDVMLGKIRLGYARYHHLKKTELNGKPVNLISFETRIVRFHDQETIYSDLETSLPLLVERKVSRLIKPEQITEVYDQKNFILTITKKRWTQKQTVIKKDGPIHNAILLPHFVRNKVELDIGWMLDINLPTREYKIKLVSREDIEVPAGKFKAYYFESEPKQIKIWISADEHKIPLRIEGTGVLGYRLVMKEYSLPEKLEIGNR